MIKNNFIIFLIFYCLKITLIFSQNNFPYELTRYTGGTCYQTVKVKDERPANCLFTNSQTILYKVLVEDFDFKQELPNNWRFNCDGKDDDYKNGTNGRIWIGDEKEPPSNNPYYNNLDVSGGIGKFLFKKEDRNNMEPWGAGNGTKNYKFTGAFLNSLFHTKQGIVKAVIRWPDNNLFWPGFWKRGETSGATQEIDVFESWDGDINDNNCDTYHQMRMHMHVNNPSGYSHRGRKFNVPSGPYGFYSGFHTFTCKVTDYVVDFDLDGTVVGKATKYYDGPYYYPVCTTSDNNPVPQTSYSCVDMTNLKSCIAEFPGTPPRPNNLPSWIPWPYIAPYCIIENKVEKDLCFPDGKLNMDIRVSMSIYNDGNRDQLHSDWESAFNDVDARQFAIDRIEVWHLINCSRTLNLITIGDFNGTNGSDGTGFASGGVINIGNSISTSTFINLPAALNSPTYQHNPMHLLATDEISFQGNVEIREDTYLRAEIISCSGQSFSERLIGNNAETLDDKNMTSDEIDKTEKQKLEDYLNEHPEMKDSISKMQEQEKYFNQMLDTYKQQNLTSLTDNGSIVVYPNPTKDFLYIDMVEEDFNDILYLEITDNLGQSIKMNKSKQIDLSSFASGMYQLKFVFSHGYIVIKSVSKI